MREFAQFSGTVHPEPLLSPSLPPVPFIDLSSGVFDAARTGIDEQRILVGSLVPGTRPHRAATGVLLLLQDSLFVMAESRAMIETTRQQVCSRPSPL